MYSSSFSSSSLLLRARTTITKRRDDFTAEKEKTSSTVALVRGRRRRAFRALSASSDDDVLNEKAAEAAARAEKRKRVIASALSSSKTKSEAEKFSENVFLEEDEARTTTTTTTTKSKIDEEKVARLTRKKEELEKKVLDMQNAIDSAYELLFEGVLMADAEAATEKEEDELAANVSDAFIEDFPVTTEKKFKNVCEIDPKVGERLLKIASGKDGKKYLQFQKAIHASKGTLARVSNELEANELALSTAARGGRGFLSRPEEEEEEEERRDDEDAEGISIDDEALYLSSKKNEEDCVDFRIRIVQRAVV